MLHKIPDWLIFAMICGLFALVAVRLVLRFAVG